MHVKEYNQKYCAEYYEKNKETLIPEMTVYTTNRRRTNINVRLASNLRRRLTHIIKGTVKVGSAVRDLGCSVEELKVYLEGKFTEGMTWDNYGFGNDKWNIDHIEPLSKFDLSNIEQFKQANHFSNLQPLWQQSNFRKGNR